MDQSLISTMASWSRVQTRDDPGRPGGAPRFGVGPGGARPGGAPANSVAVLGVRGPVPGVPALRDLIPGVPRPGGAQTHQDAMIRTPLLLAIVIEIMAPQVKRLSV